MGGSANKSVVEYVACAGRVIVAGLRKTRNGVLLDNFGVMGLASISVMNAAKRPMLWAVYQRWAKDMKQAFPLYALEECWSDLRGMPLTSERRRNLSLRHPGGRPRSQMTVQILLQAPCY